MADFATLVLKVDSTGVKPGLNAINGLGAAGEKVIGVMKGIGAALGLAAMAKAVSDVAVLRARYDTLGTVMRVVGNNAGYTAGQMEAYAQSLQKAGISMVESRNTLAMMASAHIDLNNAQKLGRIAQDAAVIGNVNSSEAFQRMIYGIQSGQVEILRTIGINVNFEQSYKKLAQQLGKSAASLTELEKVQARTNVVMEKGRDIAGAYEESMGTVGKAAKSLERIWENLRVISGGMFQEGFTVIVDGLTSAFQTATDWVNRYGTEIGQLGTAMADVVRQSIEFGKMLSDLGGGAQGAAEGVGALTWIFRGMALIIGTVTDLIRAFVAAAAQNLGFILEKLGKIIDAVTTLGGVLGRGNFAGWGRDLQAYGNNLASALDKQTATGGMLDKWLDDQGKLVLKAEEIKRRTAILAGGPTAQAAGLMSAHSQDPREQARISAGIFSRAEQQDADKKRQNADAMTKILGEQEKFFQKMADAYDKAVLSASELLDLELKRLKIQDSMGVAIAHQVLESAELAKLELKPNAQEDIQIATVNTAALTTATAKLRAEFAQMRVFVPTTWDIISNAVMDSSRMASDELVAWMNNLDGVGRSWETLGDTVRAVLRDMIIQMQRAIVQQQLMDPLIRWGVTALGGMFAGSTTPTTGGTAGGGLNWGEVPIANPMGGSAPVNAQIAINITPGEGVTTEASSAAAAELAQRIARGEIRQWAAKEMLHGGVLARS